MLGLLGYCRLWIDQFAKLVRFLNQKLVGDGEITWGQDDEQRWEEVKKTLIGAPVLALPNLQQPFHLYVTISSQTAVGVLAQKRGRYQPVAYLSRTLEPVVRAWPTCIQVVAAAAELVVESRKLTFGGALIVHSPHQISTVLTGAASTWMTDGRLTHYETVLRTSPDITLGTDRNLNPAEFLIGERKEWEPDEHDCLGTIQLMAKVREDLSETPLTMGERWYIDGSSYVKEGKRKSGYAVVKEDGEVIESGALPANWSAQKSEIMALTRALELARGLEVTIWTDSRYAWGVVHTFGRTWRDRGRGILAQRPPLLEQQHSFQPGDLVLIKTWKAEKLSPGWDGPFRVLLITESAVRTREYGWTHYHRVKRAPPERWTAIPSLDDPLKIRITKSGTGNQGRTVRQ
ncbi:RMB88642.1hypothetical protein DUI87_34981 [Podarcis lilfordi]|uniref:RNase H type-1 domain-containing protein n=1 Tax=Podarcis lilfordi TaxID=74358 RepID=A0AA35P085_9SAUR|nr:RMB88642.1hypothetical protein DUI87_34981 [Podarcis lilfordi]